MRNKKFKIKVIPEAVCYQPLEVTAKECGFDTSKMIKRFMKKTRKEEVLKPFHTRLLYWETKSQKARRKKLKSIYEHRKQQEIDNKIDDE